MSNEKMAAASDMTQPYRNVTASGMPVVVLRLKSSDQINQTYAATLAANTTTNIALVGMTGGTGPGSAPAAGAFTQGMSLNEVMNLLGLNISGINDLVELTLLIRKVTTLNTVESEAFNLLSYNTMDAFQNTKYTVPCNVLVRPGEMCFLVAKSTAGGTLSISGVVKNIDC